MVAAVILKVRTDELRIRNRFYLALFHFQQSAENIELVESNVSDV